jgi:hypothetical protein
VLISKHGPHEQTGLLPNTHGLIVPIFASTPTITTLLAFPFSKTRFFTKCIFIQLLLQRESILEPLVSRNSSSTLYKVTFFPPNSPPEKKPSYYIFTSRILSLADILCIGVSLAIVSFTSCKLMFHCSFFIGMLVFFLAILKIFFLHFLYNL